MHEDIKVINTHTRWMIRRDMPEVLAIERGSFANPWSDEDFLSCLRQVNCIGFVAEHDDKILGFSIYELTNKTLRLRDLAVHQDYRQRGVGHRLVAKMVNKLSSHRRQRIVVDVRETNLRAQLFFRRQSFRAIRVLPGFFKDTGEDAFRMEYRHVEPDKPVLDLKTTSESGGEHG